jgi:hypothetical protein
MATSGILIKEAQQAFIDDGVDDAFDFAVHELHLRLRVEARIRQL